MLIITTSVVTAPLAAKPARTHHRVYLDPVDFCAAVGTTSDVVYRSSEPRYRGPDRPAWLVRAMGYKPSDAYIPAIDWRCSNGRVLACEEGNSGRNAQVCFKEFNGGRWDPAVWKVVRRP
jgi:hypothetical protein